MNAPPYTIAQVFANLETMIKIAHRDPQWIKQTARDIITRGITRGITDGTGGTDGTDGTDGRDEKDTKDDREDLALAAELRSYWSEKPIIPDPTR